MMNFMNFDLAKAITEDRRERALEASRLRRQTGLAAAREPLPTPEADIVELVFPTTCEPDQIGA
jgi:hypothetical protein